MIPHLDYFPSYCVDGLYFILPNHHTFHGEVLLGDSSIIHLASVSRPGDDRDKRERVTTLRLSRSAQGAEETKFLSWLSRESLSFLPRHQPRCMSHLGAEDYRRLARRVERSCLGYSPIMLCGRRGAPVIHKPRLTGARPGLNGGLGPLGGYSTFSILAFFGHLG